MTIYISLIENFAQYGFLLVEAESGEALASRTFLSEETRDKVAAFWSKNLKVPVVRKDSDDKLDLSNVLYFSKSNLLHLPKKS